MEVCSSSLCDVGAPENEGGEEGGERVSERGAEKGEGESVLDVLLLARTEGALGFAVLGGAFWRERSGRRKVAPSMGGRRGREGWEARREGGGESAFDHVAPPPTEREQERLTGLLQRLSPGRSAFSRSHRIRTSTLDLHIPILTLPLPLATALPVLLGSSRWRRRGGVERARRLRCASDLLLMLVVMVVPSSLGADDKARTTAQSPSVPTGLAVKRSGGERTSERWRRSRSRGRVFLLDMRFGFLLLLLLLSHGVGGG